MSGIPLDELGATEQERTLLRRVGLVAAAIVVGATGGVSAYALADSRFDDVESRVGSLESYVHEEREARCAVAQNVYALCLRTGVDCLPVSASCAGRRGGR